MSDPAGALVIVDVLSFTTAVTVAVGKGPSCIRIRGQLRALKH